MNEEQKIAAERQKFQSNKRLFALKVHAMWTKVEDVILYLPRKLARSIDQTDVFVERDQPHLKVVK